MNDGHKKIGSARIKKVINSQKFKNNFQNNKKKEI